MFLLHDPQPALLRHIMQRPSNRLMPHLPPHALQHRIRIGNRPQLILRRRWELVLRQDSLCFSPLLGVVLPFDVAVPAGVFFGEEDRGVVGAGLFVCGLEELFFCGVAAVAVDYVLLGFAGFAFGGLVAEGLADGELGCR
jgi:hypothetical protein